MADKEATVYIIDLGQSMSGKHHGRSESDLYFGMRYVWDKISTTVAASRKTWTVGVIGLRTDETHNPHQELDGYDNISVIQEIGPMSMTSLRELKDQIRPSITKQGDAISAIVVAEHMITAFTKKLKYNRKTILVTDARGAMDGNSLDEVAGKLNDSNIELVVIGIDFDDADYGFKEEDKPSRKADNEKMLAKLVDQCKNGVFGTMAQAVEELSVPRIKPVRPFKTYDGVLTLGDPESPNSMSIAVERYFKTKQANPPSASTVVVKPESGGPSRYQAPEADEMEGVEITGDGGFSVVKQVRAYRVNDPDAPGGKKDVEFESLSKGYMYGRTVVPISESDQNVTKLVTKKSFTIIGFIPWTSYELYLSMGEAGVIVAQKFNEKAEVGLSSLVNALYELESYAVARLVVKDDKDPYLHLLIPNPRLDSETDCLYDVPLPFAEDVRPYQFPPLDKVLTIDGTVIKQHRLLPTDDLNKAMGDFVDAMDLSNFGQDDEGNPAEYAPIDETSSPTIHRINQAVCHRAVHPDKPLQPPAEILLRYSSPPEALIEQIKNQTNTLIKTANLKKVPNKIKGKRKRETVKPMSGLDVDALLAGTGTKRTKISPENAVPEFKQTLAAATDDLVILSAAKQMGDIICTLIRESFADINYDRAAENLRVLRTEMIELEFTDTYNEYIRDLKEKILGGELDGDRREMWTEKIVGGKLGLITNAEAEESTVTEQEAKDLRSERENLIVEC